MNIIALIDQESSKFPKGTDRSELSRKVVQILFNAQVLFEAQVERHTRHIRLDPFRRQCRVQHTWILGEEQGHVLGRSLDVSARTPTLGAQFKRSFDALMATLNSCPPFFIRCI